MFSINHIFKKLSRKKVERLDESDAASGSTGLWGAGIRGIKKG
jgi:hypothetical protein